MEINLFDKNNMQILQCLDTKFISVFCNILVGVEMRVQLRINHIQAFYKY